MVKKSLSIALIAIFASAVLVFNGCRSHSANHKAEFMVDYIAETLDLSDTQRAQLDEIKEEFLAKAKDMHAEKEAMHTEFKVELLKEEIDQDRMKALMAQKREQMAEMMDLAVLRLAEFHKTLSTEQREKLVAKLEYFHEKHSRHWE
jgi:Spy/CpxP family protein refolding chaperone